MTRGTPTPARRSVPASRSQASGAMLGPHSSMATTERYAHLTDDPGRKHAEVVGAALENRND
jgi:hypothetical protein